MSGLFNGLEIGKSALATHQLWMNTIGHNIANANTVGYTRQRVLSTTANPMQGTVGPIGAGVNAIGIRSIRDNFLIEQFRKENQEFGMWLSQEKTLDQIEQIMYEPSSGSLGTLMSQFWDSWSDVATNPQDATFRNTLITNTNLMTGQFHRIHEELSDLQKSIDNEIKLNVQKINNLADELAAINLQVARTEIGSDRANDLRDKRDYLIDQLSSITKVNVVEEENGSANIFIGSLSLVEKDSAFKLGTYRTKSGELSLSNISWKGTDKDVKIVGGELSGLLNTRDNVIPKYIAALDEMAAAMVNNLNSVHQQGYGLDGSTGLDFFDPANITAATISISMDVGGSPEKIGAASEDGAVGNNINALLISELRESTLLDRGTTSISSFYQTLVGNVATDSQKAKSMLENSALLVHQAENSRQSVQGVSLDEEMAQMIKYQHAYDAAARVITTMDQALETVINNMGLVGR